jgi:hypothetical protein
MKLWVWNILQFLKGTFLGETHSYMAGCHGTGSWRNRMWGLWWIRIRSNGVFVDTVMNCLFPKRDNFVFKNILHVQVVCMYLCIRKRWAKIHPALALRPSRSIISWGYWESGQWLNHCMCRMRGGGGGGDVNEFELQIMHDLKCLCFYHILNDVNEK